MCDKVWMTGKGVKNTRHSLFHKLSDEEAFFSLRNTESNGHREEDSSVRAISMLRHPFAGSLEQSLKTPFNLTVVDTLS